MLFDNISTFLYHTHTRINIYIYIYIYVCVYVYVCVCVCERERESLCVPISICQLEKKEEGVNGKVYIEGLVGL